MAKQTQHKGTVTDTSARSGGTATSPTVGTTISSFVHECLTKDDSLVLPHSRPPPLPIRRHESILGSRQRKQASSDVPSQEVLKKAIGGSSFGAHRNLARFSGDPEEGERRKLCPIPQRTFSIPSVGAKDIYILDDSDIISSTAALDEDTLRSSNPFAKHRKLGSDLCCLHEKTPLSDPSHVDLERLVGSMREYPNLDRFSAISKGGFVNPCPMPQRNASLADIDNSSRSEDSTAPSTPSDIEFIHEFSTMSSITLDEDLVSSSGPDHRRNGSSISLFSLQEDEALSFLPAEDPEKPKRFLGDRNNVTRFVEGSELCKPCPMPQRSQSSNKYFECTERLENWIPSVMSKQSHQPSYDRREERNWNNEDDKPCMMPRRELSEAIQSNFFFKEESEEGKEADNASELYFHPASSLDPFDVYAD